MSKILEEFIYFFNTNRWRCSLVKKLLYTVRTVQWWKFHFTVEVVQIRITQKKVLCPGKYFPLRIHLQNQTESKFDLWKNDDRSFTLQHYIITYPTIAIFSLHLLYSPWLHSGYISYKFLCSWQNFTVWNTKGQIRIQIFSINLKFAFLLSLHNDIFLLPRR